MCAAMAYGYFGAYRFVLALMVVASHLGAYSPAREFFAEAKIGYTAVLLFFVASRPGSP